MAARLFFFQALLFLIAFSSIDALDYMCPGVMSGPRHYKKVHFEPKLGGRSGQGYAKMRFRIFYDKSMDKMPPVFKSLTQEVTDFWSKVLSVRPFDGTMFIERNCEESEPVYTYYNESKKYEKRCSGPCANTTICSDTVVPEEHLKECTYCLKNGTECHTTGRRGKGIENADMVFYVSALQNCHTTTIAYATPCESDPYLDRPIVGGFNFCPFRALPLIKKMEFLVEVIKHEMMHALGFHPGFYNLFRDSNGQPLVERDKYGEPIFKSDKGEFGPKVVKNLEREWHVRGGTVSSNRTFIVTPNVVREARAHFNCSELEGAELEDSGGSGTAGAHWEARVYYTEIMKSTIGDRQQMSRIDFALLQDTGWYKVNYSFAEPMKYGRDLGCDFCMNSCKYWMDKRRSEGKSVEPFCDRTAEQSSKYLCNKTDKVYSGCPLKRKRDPVLKDQQYFDKLEGVDDNELHFYSGDDRRADFCPIPLTDNIVSCKSQLSQQDALSLNMDPLSNIALQAYGNNSYCFESRTNWTIKEYRDTCSQVKPYGEGENAGCYKYYCLSGLLVIEILNKRFPCFFEGQVLKVNLFGLTGNVTHGGSVVCPSCKQICGQSSDFKCMPDNQILASKYLYPRDECIDDDYLKKMIKSLDGEGKKSSTETKGVKKAQAMKSDIWTTIESLTTNSEASVVIRNNDKFHLRSQSCKLGPTNLIRVLLAFIVIVNYR